MSLWYDSRRHEYAMDGKNGWFIKYCDKLAADFGKLCEDHFKGTANRHKADDVDYDEEMTVKEKLDKETADRKAVDENIMTGLEFERSAREGADTALGGRIDAEAEARENADAALDDKIDKEIERSKGVDITFNNAFLAEVNKRQSEDAALGGRIDAEAEARESADTALDDKIDKEIERSKGVDSTFNTTFLAEVNKRQSEDAALGGRIDAEAEARENADADKADRGVVTRNTIDQTTAAGIYGANNTYVSYKMYDDFSHEVLVSSSSLLKLLLVADDDDNITQIGFVETDDVNKYISVQRNKTKEGNWSDWIITTQYPMNWARRGVVSKDTIDQCIQAGIYGAEEDMTIQYTYDYDETGKLNNDGWLLILFVSSDRPGNVTQFAIVDNDSGYKFRGVQRTKTKGGQWTKWHTLDGGSGKNDGGDPFVMYGKYDLTKYPRGITCMNEAAADNNSWTLDYTIPPISITNSVLGTVELKDQDVVYDGLTEKDEGKTFSAFAEYKKDDNYAAAKIIIDESPMRKKDYAILKSSKELSLIRLYLGDFTVNEIHIGGGAGPDGTRPEESSADISFNYPENNNPEIYILNYVYLTDNRGSFKNGADGFNAGDQSDASDGGGAIGRLAKTTSGGAVGSEAESNNGFAGGYHVKVGGMGAAIGANASAYHGGAVGSGTQAGSGFAGGMDAKCGKAPNGADVDCIQLGTGTNGNEKTLKVYDYQLTALDAQGKQHLSDVGDISKLKTADKTDIVSAINKIVSEIEEIKKSAAASINSIGDGLKITDGVLSVDCASVSDTENAVNGIVNN